MTVLGDPAVLERIADRYEVHGDAVCAAGQRLRLAAESTSWECEAADRFGWEALATQSAAERFADELRTSAYQLRSLAGSIRDEIAALETIEARVRHALASADQLTSRWQFGNLPPPRDPAWRVVARSMGL